MLSKLVICTGFAPLILLYFINDRCLVKGLEKTVCHPIKLSPDEYAGAQLELVHQDKPHHGARHIVGVLVKWRTMTPCDFEFTRVFDAQDGPSLPWVGMDLLNVKLLEVADMIILSSRKVGDIKYIRSPPMGIYVLQALGLTD